MDDPIKIIEGRMNALNKHFESQRALLKELKKATAEAEKKMLRANGAYEELKQIKDFLEAENKEEEPQKESQEEQAAANE